MTETPPGLENNRFEALHQKFLNRQRKPGRWRRRILAVVVLLVVGELFSLIATFGVYWSRGVRSDRLLDQFLVTRYVVSPFVFDNPVTKYTKARYLGPITNQCVAARWRMPDTLLGWVQAPSVGILKQPYLVDVIGWRFTNAQGFPSSGDYVFFYERPKPRGTFRVIVTGASTVEGDGAENPKLNLVAQFREQLERELNGKLGPAYDKIEVINAGVGGYQSSQEYLYLITDLISYEPDLVISYGGTVDLARAWNAYDREGRTMEPIRTFRHVIDSHYLQQSFTILSPLVMFVSNIRRAGDCAIEGLAMTYFIGKVYEKAEGLVRRLTGTNRKVLEPQSAKPDLTIPVKAALSSYNNSIKLMMKAAEVYGFRIAFALQPALTKDQIPFTAIEKEMLNSLSGTELTLRSTFLAAARGMLAEYRAANGSDSRFCFVDVSRPFEGVQERVWDDTRHLLGIGNRIVAGKLVDALKACKQTPEQ